MCPWLCMKTVPKLSVVGCFVAVLSTALLYGQREAPGAKTKDDLTPWVENCLKDFETLKAGMTRGEIEGKFPMDGGLQGLSRVRFAHPTCAYFKIDVDFEAKGDGADPDRVGWGKDDKATKTSKPYLERPFFD